MVRTALVPLLLLGSLTCVACCSSRPPKDSASTAGSASPASPPSTEGHAMPATSKAAPCDFKIKTLSDPAQKQIECPNGDQFIIRQGADGKWSEEMKVRAGLRPSYDTPEAAARARCCG